MAAPTDIAVLQPACRGGSLDKLRGLPSSRRAETATVADPAPALSSKAAVMKAQLVVLSRVRREDAEQPDAAVGLFRALCLRARDGLKDGLDRPSGLAP